MTTFERVWFVTGISRGFGRALVEPALKNGDYVIGTTRSGTLDAAPASDRLRVLPLDVTHSRDIEPLVAQAWNTFGFMPQN